MSAFFVGYDHINAMLAWYETTGPYAFRGNDTEKERMGRVLVAENLRSLHARYKDMPEEQKVVDLYKFAVPQNSDRLKPVDILCMCDSYDYQACETDDYRQTE